MIIQSYQFQSMSRTLEFKAVANSRPEDAAPESTAETAMTVQEHNMAFRLDILFQTRNNALKQSGAASEALQLPEIASELQYNGRPITDLTPDEARQLVSEDGYFGVKKTAARIANFILQGAGDDLERLKAGREGILNGLKAAEEAWGGTLPDISYQTITKALEAVDNRIAELENRTVDIAV